MRLLHTSPMRQRGDRCGCRSDPLLVPLAGVSLAIRAGIVAAACWLQLNAAVAEERGWEFEPYRIDAVIAIDAPGGLAEKLADKLPLHLQRRVTAAIGPAWSFTPHVASSLQRQIVLSEITTLADAPSSELPNEGDKLLLISVRWRPDGCHITTREFDRYVERWGMPIHRQSRQVEMLGEQIFVLVWQTVAPLARFEAESNDDRRVVLQPRAAGLPRPSADATWCQAGDVFLPLARRTTRDGELVEGGVQVVPWTYIEAEEVAEEHIIGRVHSGTRQPLPARRQGRIEPVAIALRGDPGDTVLRLHSRTASEKPLVGYEVFAQHDGQQTPDPIGSSDRHGRIAIPTGETRVQTLFVKSGGQLLARFPIVPGAEREVEVPLPDDDVRLAAEARLAALREEVVDVVARRNILMARARQKIEASDFAAAQELLQSLDELPSRAQFNLTLTTAARLLRSDDPQIQRRIDQLFAATQTVVNQYLDVRPISQLHDELREAQRQGT